MNIQTAESGFSLIELMVVMTIIAILTAIALPQYSRYKKMAFDVRAREDLRSVAIAEEAYFMESERYLSCANNQCTDLPGVSRISKGVQISMTANDTNFTGQAQHPQGTGVVFRWDSEHGGLQNGP